MLRLLPACLAAAIGAHAGVARAQPAILLWPADEAVAPRAAKLAETISDRGGLAPVDDGPLRARVAAGPRLDPLVLVSDAGRVAESAGIVIQASPESAVEMTRRPEREYLADLATPTGVRGLVALALVRARAHVVAGDREAAQREAMFAVALDHGGEIDAASLPAETRPLVEAAQEDLPRLPRVGVAVESAPDGARVTVDGRPAGRTPLEVEVAPGTHVVRLDRPGFMPVAQIFDVGVEGAGLPPFPLRAARGEPLLEQIATLAAAGEFALDNAEIVALLAVATQARYVGVVRRSGTGMTVTIFEPAARESPGVASGRTPEAVAAVIETMTLGAPARSSAPPPPRPELPRDAFYEKWWFWAAAGAVVLAGTVTVVVLSQPEPQGVVRWGH